MGKFDSRLKHLSICRTFILSTLLVLIGLTAQPVQPAYASWALDCSDPDNLDVMGIDQAQCESLESIYENLSGDEWTNSDGWGTATDVDTWWGVMRHDTSVTWLDLPDNNLTGNIQDIDISGLTGLYGFNLSDNQIEGNIDELDFSSLAALDYFSLGNNNIGGNIDNLNLSGLTHLYSINLYSNNIGGSIDGLNLSGLTALETIYLNGNQIGGNIDRLNLSDLPNLRRLELSNNQIGGNIDGLDLSNQIQLEGLDLDNNPIGGSIDGLNLSGLTTLEYISLGNNNIGGDIDGFDLTGLTALMSLNLRHTNIGGDIEGLNLSGLSSLRVLDLRNSQIGGDIGKWNPGSMDLNELKQLNLAHNQIDGDISGLNLSGLNKLEYLSLSNNQIGGNIDGWNLSDMGLETLEEIDLTYNQIGGDIDKWHLSNLVSLRDLQLFENQIGGDFGNWNLSDVSSLTAIRLANNRIGGDIGDWHLGTMGFSNVYSISLEDNQIGGDIANLDLTGLDNLVALYLGNNQIEGDPSGIAVIPPRLSGLKLNNNRLNGTVPDLIGTRFHLESSTYTLLWLCPNPAVNPTGYPAIDDIAEAAEELGWTAESGCGPTDLVVTGAACNGDDLEVTIATGDGPFDITGAGGPDLPRKGVSIGTITLTGPGSWVGVTVTETTDDLESFNLGDFACPLPNLAAAAACNGSDLEVTITSGDTIFRISADDPAAVTQSAIATEAYTLVSSHRSGTWTNITVTELSGDTETITLPDVTCDTQGGIIIPLWVWPVIAGLLIVGAGGYVIGRRRKE